jgi:hypothetical protein
MSRPALARRLFGSPVVAAGRAARCLTIDVRGLRIENPAPNIFRVPGSTPLDVSDRIIGSEAGPP